MDKKIFLIQISDDNFESFNVVKLECYSIKKIWSDTVIIDDETEITFNNCNINIV